MTLQTYDRDLKDPRKVEAKHPELEKTRLPGTLVALHHCQLRLIVKSDERHNALTSSGEERFHMIIQSSPRKYIARYIVSGQVPTVC